MFVVGHAGLFHQRAGPFGVRLARGKLGIFGVHRADMVVFGHQPATGITQLKQHGVIDRHGQRPADTRIGIGCLAIHLGQLVGADHDGCTRGDFVLVPAVQRAEHVDEFTLDGIGGVDLFCFGGGDKGRRVSAVVDVFQPVDIGPAVDLGAPPRVVGVLDQHGLDPDFDRFGQVGAGADRVVEHGFRIKPFGDDGGGVIGHAGDQGDVGAGQRQLDRMVIHHGDRAFDRLTGVLVDQRGKAPGHRVALDRFIAPARDVARHIVGGEGRAIVPRDTFAHIQHIFGGVFVDLPAFEQCGGEGAVVLPDREIFKPATGDVGDLRPVVGARIFQRADLHLHPYGAAGFMRGRMCGRCHADHRIGGCRRGPKGAGEGQKLASVDRIAFGSFGRGVDGGG